MRSKPLSGADGGTQGVSQPLGQGPRRRWNRVRRDTHPSPAATLPPPSYVRQTAAEQGGWGDASSRALLLWLLRSPAGGGPPPRPRSGTVAVTAARTWQGRRRGWSDGRGCRACASRPHAHCRRRRRSAHAPPPARRRRVAGGGRSQGGRGAALALWRPRPRPAPPQLRVVLRPERCLSPLSVLSPEEGWGLAEVYRIVGLWNKTPQPLVPIHRR